MSAVSKTAKFQGALGAGNIRRYKTRCKLVVHSHNNDKPIEIFDAVYAVDTSKSIKGVGVATCMLTPMENWLNIVFPNDVINIYFDIGDEQGWVRTFFGYIDRVEETYSVDPSGNPSTLYRLVCSDFQKCFDKTQVYFNPQLAGRPDFIDFDFAENNIGGLALQSKGIQMGGPPSMMVNELILLLMDFGAQFRLPESYVATSSKDRLRNRRVEALGGQLPTEYEDLGGASARATYKRWRTDTSAKLRSDLAQYYQQNDSAEAGQLIAEAYNVDPQVLEGVDNPDEVFKILQDPFLLAELEKSQSFVGASATRRSAARRSKAILDSSISDVVSLIDVVDPFTFVETRAMDGFTIGRSVWTQQGSLLSTLRTISNESVNELFFDLRGLNYDKEKKSIHTDLLSGNFGRAKDDAEGNIGGVGAKTGVYYTPAVVMREYPFSTIQGLNLPELKVNIKGDKEDGGDRTIGFLQFGAIFSDVPNTPGRHVLTVQNINIPEQGLGGTPPDDTPGFKHLDVAVVNEEEITKSQLGRSDRDHFNLFEYFSDSLLGIAQKWYMKDFLPVITPIHIVRNGLRVRTVTTKAARFDINAVRKFVLSEASAVSLQTSSSELEAVSIEDFVSPIADPSAPVYFPRSDTRANWNYRLKKPDSNDQSTWFWAWHHGIDIMQTGDVAFLGNGKTTWTTDPPNTDVVVQAIADGEVVVSAPEGVTKNYGDVVVIRHKFEDTFFYTVYAHLKTGSRLVGWKKNEVSGGQAMRKFCFASGMSGAKGQMTPERVEKGQPIGILGRTGIKRSAAHLHFEVLSHYPAGFFSAKRGFTPRLPYLPDYSTFTPQNPPTQQAGQPQMEGDFFKWVENGESPAGQVSFDPQLTFGSQLSGISGSQKDFEAEDDRTDIEEDSIDLQLSTVDKPDDPAEEAQESVKNVEAPQNRVDTVSSRKQIIRWALLQDHWYQHNLEYLSGRITMRGAPEIRVGYRLDLPDRDMSFYIEAVNHSWKYPNAMNSTLSVSRGQPHNPFPVYVMPAYSQVGGTKQQRRTNNSRLAKYFITPDPVAIRRSLFIKSDKTIMNDPGLKTSLGRTGRTGKNWTDVFQDAEEDKEKGILIVQSGSGKNPYKEAVVPAGRLIEEDQTLNAEDTNRTNRGTDSSVRGIPPSPGPKDVKANG